MRSYAYTKYINSIYKINSASYIGPVSFFSTDLINSKPDFKDSLRHLAARALKIILRPLRSCKAVSIQNGYHLLTRLIICFKNKVALHCIYMLIRY